MNKQDWLIDFAEEAQDQWRRQDVNWLSNRNPAEQKIILDLQVMKQKVKSWPDPIEQLDESYWKNQEQKIMSIIEDKSLNQTQSVDWKKQKSRSSVSK